MPTNNPKNKNNKKELGSNRSFKPRNRANNAPTKAGKAAKAEAKPVQIKPAFFATARGAAAFVVNQVMGEGAYTNIAVNNFLRNHQLNDMDRRFFTELTYGTIKATGTLDWYLTKCVSMSLNKLEPLVLSILRISVFQLKYLERVPASAVVNEAVKLTRIISNEGSTRFVNGVLRSLMRKQEAGELEFPDESIDDENYLSLKYFHPRWMIRRWLGVYGREGTEALLAFDNTPAPVCLRTNTLVTTREQLMAQLTEAGAEVKASVWSADGIVVEKMPALSELFKKLEHSFYVQDESSMVVADVVAAEPGQLLLDLCSAPGGKATHIAQRMQNQGTVMACDVHEHKLKLIAANAERLQLSIVKPTLKDATIIDLDMLGKADRVLVDAPCSGLGVLRRRAEARWRKQRTDLQLFPPVQLQILHNAARYVKEGGRLVYSTCTVEQSENHYLIESFLEKHPNWQRVAIKHPISGEMVEELQLLPQVDNIDGFYICALEKRV